MSNFTPFFVRWTYGGYVGNRYSTNLVGFGRVIAVAYEPSVFMLLVENESSGMLTRKQYDAVEVLDESTYRRLATSQIRRQAKKRKP